MNILKGKFTVFSVSLVASGMIVLNGSSVAEDKVETVLEKTDSAIIANTATQKISAKKEENSKFSPPPGPFLISDIKETMDSREKSLVAPTAPKAPMRNIKMPELKANSIHFNKTPNLAGPTITKDISKEISKNIEAPKVDLAQPQIPVKPEFTNEPPKAKENLKTPSDEKVLEITRAPKIKGFSATAPQAPKQSVQQPNKETADLPIWTKGENVIKKEMIAPNQNQPNNTSLTMPNMGWNNNIPNQQYIYIPMPMVPSNMMPPQMPMFNGNLIPPANYWGANMQPTYVPNVEMPKGNIE